MKMNKQELIDRLLEIEILAYRARIHVKENKLDKLISCLSGIHELDINIDTDWSVDLEKTLLENR